MTSFFVQKYTLQTPKICIIFVTFSYCIFVVLLSDGLIRYKELLTFLYLLKIAFVVFNVTILEKVPWATGKNVYPLIVKGIFSRHVCNPVHLWYVSSGVSVLSLNLED